jgi:hypothetical protein
MRVADLLRAMVDMVDSAEQQNSRGSAQPAPTVVVVNNTPNNQQQQPQQQQPAPQQQQPAGTLNPVQVSNTDDSEKTTMVPPLQQKIELLKKSVGVNNEFSQGFDQVDQEHEAEQQGQQEPDELERVKKMAGIPQAVQHELAKDEPLDF